MLGLGLTGPTLFDLSCCYLKWGANVSVNILVLSYFGLFQNVCQRSPGPQGSAAGEAEYIPEERAGQPQVTV